MNDVTSIQILKSKELPPIIFEGEDQVIFEHDNKKDFRLLCWLNKSQNSDLEVNFTQIIACRYLTVKFIASDPGRLNLPREPNVSIDTIQVDGNLIIF